MVIHLIGIRIRVEAIVSPIHPQVQFGLENGYRKAGSDMLRKIELDERPFQAIAAQFHDIV